MARLTAEQIAATGITLKKLAHNSRLSEETECFSADVYIHGKKEGTVANRGQGGSDEYHPWSLEEKLNAIAATLPPYTLDLTGWKNVPDSAREPTPYTAETMIGDILSVALAEKQLARLLKSRLLFLRDNAVHQTSQLKGGLLATRLDAIRKGQLPTYLTKTDIVLNLLPPAEALATFLAHT